MIATEHRGGRPAALPAFAPCKEPWFWMVSDAAIERFSMLQIKRAVCRHYGLDIGAMATTSRARKLWRPRQIAMYLCREMTRKSLSQIGRAFGGRHHTTPLSAWRKINRLMARDRRLSADIAKIRARLEASS
jgi:chromosomal replication initiator protein